MNTMEGTEGNFITEVSDDQVLELTFSSLEEVHSFYLVYSKAHGFHFRSRDTQKRSVGDTREVTSRKWVCAREGLRLQKWLDRPETTRKHKRITRCGCDALLRTKLNRVANVWQIVQFNNAHNHEMVPLEQSHFLRGHRLITTTDLAQINSMRFVGIRPCQILQLLVHQFGGHGNVGFIDTDLYNAIYRTHEKDRQNGDFQRSLGYLEEKKNHDPGFIFAHTSNGDGSWANLFWCDSISRIDYASFGDVITFDSTHSTNAYGKPMVIFVGINHHHQTCIFAAALLEHETVESYMWLLRTLLAAMGDKKPISVLTDGDLAMKKAISEIFPRAAHRLCSWHLQRIAQSKVHDKAFTNDFSGCMYTKSKQRFDQRWATLIEKYHLVDSQWASNLYSTREMWCCAFFQGSFFGGQHANSRSESMNKAVKRYVGKNNNLYEMLRHFDSVLARNRNKEARADFDTSSSRPVIKHPLSQIEQQAVRIYTGASFAEFQKELLGVGNVVTVRPPIPQGMRTQYVVANYTKPWRPFIVAHDIDAEMILCSCKKFEREGFVCRHIIYVVKERNEIELPETCFKKRWTKFAKEDAPINMPHLMLDEDLTMIRIGALAGMASELNHKAGQTSLAFNHVRTEFAKLLDYLKDLDSQTSAAHTNSTLNQTHACITNNPTSNIGECSRGQASRRCGRCGEHGHNSRTCKRTDEEVAQLRAGH